MATREFIEKRIEGKKAEITKLEKKLERIMAAKESNWENNPYYYHENDIKYTTRDIDSAYKALDKYEKDLADLAVKEASRNVPAITEFLDRWQERCEEYYGNGLKRAFEAKAYVTGLREKRDVIRYGAPGYDEADSAYKAAYEEYHNKLHGYYKEVVQHTISGHTYNKRVKERDGELEFVKDYMTGNYDESMARVHKDVEQEKARKYDFIIERTTSITGTITDASYLSVGAKGDLNGLIFGEKGTASVTTFGAGGYNIQCYHFRTTIRAAKPREIKEATASRGEDEER